MRKLLNKPWFVALLAIAAIAFVWSSLAPTTKHARVAVSAPAEPEPQATAEPATEEGTPPSSPEPLNQLPPPKTSRDPFAITQAVVQPNQPVETIAPVEPDLVDTVHLTALWTQNGNTLIYINDHIHNIGDVIGRITIESANPQGVWLAHAKGRTFLEMGKSFVLKTPAHPPVNKPSP